MLKTSIRSQSAIPQIGQRSSVSCRKTVFSITDLQPTTWREL